MVHSSVSINESRESPYCSHVIRNFGCLIPKSGKWLSSSALYSWILQMNQEEHRTDIVSDLSHITQTNVQLLLSFCSFYFTKQTPPPHLFVSHIRLPMKSAWRFSWHQNVSVYCCMWEEQREYLGPAQSLLGWMAKCCWSWARRGWGSWLDRQQARAVLMQLCMDAMI